MVALKKECIAFGYLLLVEDKRYMQLVTREHAAVASSQESPLHARERVVLQLFTTRG